MSEGGKEGDVKPVGPVLTVELFPGLSRELLEVLRGLAREEWQKPTACGAWSVKDVAAHLLGGNLGRLRDAEMSYPDLGSQTSEVSKTSEVSAMAYADLVSLIDEENAAWVRAARRISPKLLVEFLELTDKQLYAYFKALPAEAPANIPVSWAGEAQSPNWFDVAREYTEKWLHQQHIREAVGRPLLTGRPWLFPVLDSFMRALPYTYRAVEADAGAQAVFRITGEAGGEWSLLREKGGWQLLAGSQPGEASAVAMDQETAWRLFTKGIDRQEARSHIQVEGDESLGAEILNMVSIMA